MEHLSDILQIFNYKKCLNFFRLLSQQLFGYLKKFELHEKTFIKMKYGMKNPNKVIFKTVTNCTLAFLYWFFSYYFFKYILPLLAPPEYWKFVVFRRFQCQTRSRNSDNLNSSSEPAIRIQTISCSLNFRGCPRWWFFI